MTQLVMHWPIANASYGYGSVGWNLDTLGWSGFISTHIDPAIEWCEASDITPVILIHHPWGQYEHPWHLDGYDFAIGSGGDEQSFLTRNFTSAWRTVTANYSVFAFLGGTQYVSRLYDLPPLDLEKMIRRNLKPLQQARFSGVFIDGAENAIAHEYTYNDDAEHANSSPRSKEQLTLSIADDIFATKTGVEAVPRAFDAFESLWDRNCIAEDTTFRHRYGGFTPEQITLYGYGTRHSEHVALGYDRSVLLREVWRTLPYGEATRTRDLSVLIAEEGDVPCICPAPLIAAEIPASDCL